MALPKRKMVRKVENTDFDKLIKGWLADEKVRKAFAKGDYNKALKLLNLELTDERKAALDEINPRKVESLLKSFGTPNKRAAG